MEKNELSAENSSIHALPSVLPMIANHNSREAAKEIANLEIAKQRAKPLLSGPARFHSLIVQKIRNNLP